MLLVDFNLAEHLESEASAMEKQKLRMVVSCMLILICKLP